MSKAFFALAVAASLLWPGADCSARTLRELLTGQKPSSQQVSQRQRQAEFLARLRRSDPARLTIEKAVFNSRNELGLVLSHRVPMSAVPALMKTTLGQMARAFPGENLTVVAYAPANPPLKIGTAYFNARTRDMTYKPARRWR